MRSKLESCYHLHKDLVSGLNHIQAYGRLVKHMGWVLQVVHPMVALLEVLWVCYQEPVMYHPALHFPLVFLPLPMKMPLQSLAQFFFVNRYHLVTRPQFHTAHVPVCIFDGTNVSLLRTLDDGNSKTYMSILRPTTHVSGTDHASHRLHQGWVHL